MSTLHPFVAEAIPPASASAFVTGAVAGIAWAESLTVGSEFDGIIPEARRAFPWVDGNPTETTDHNRQGFEAGAFAILSRRTITTADFVILSIN